MFRGLCHILREMLNKGALYILLDYDPAFSYNFKSCCTERFFCYIKLRKGMKMPYFYLMYHRLLSNLVNKNRWPKSDQLVSVNCLQLVVLSLLLPTRAKTH